MVDEIKICQAQWNLFFKFCPQFNLKRYIGHRKPAIIFLPIFMVFNVSHPTMIFYLLYLLNTGSPPIALFFGSMRNPCYEKFVL